MPKFDRIATRREQYKKKRPHFVDGLCLRSVTEASTQTEDTNEKEYDYTRLCDDRADRVRANEHNDNGTDNHSRGAGHYDRNHNDLLGRYGDYLRTREDDRGQERRRSCELRARNRGTNRRWRGQDCDRSAAVRPESACLLHRYRREARG